MELAELQSEIPRLTNLLPSQREWLERLLFQMTFNKPATVNVVGAVSSGKSTLALAVAELFSDYYNVALLDASKTDLPQTLMQQWFGASVLPEASLRSQIEQANTSLPLLLIVDNADQLPAELREELAGVAAVQLEFSVEQLTGCDVVLVLNRLTNADAAQLLKGQDVNDLDIAQRLADADGDISRLLKASPAIAVSSAMSRSPAVNSYISLGAGAGLILLAVLFWYFNSASDDAAIRKADVTSVETTIPEPVSDTSAIPASDKVPATTSLEFTAEELPTTDMLQQTQDVTPAAEDEVAPVTIDEAPLQGGTVDFAQEQEQLTEESPSEEDNATATLSASELNADTKLAGYQYDESVLLSYDKSHFAVQLAVLSSDAAYQRFKNTYPSVPVVTYQRNWQGKRQFVLLLADYPDKASARNTISTLPDALRATGPFIKSIQSVQTEIRFRPIEHVNQD